MYNEEVKQSYDEQPNPPTDEVTTMAEVETLSEDELQARSVMWACVASEVGYGDYDTEESLVDRITTIETAVAGKAPTSHTHTASQVTGLAPVATTGAYDDITGKPNLSAVATSGSYNDLSDKPTAYTHPTSHPASMISGLSDVATSGSYNDLKDKPTIPTVPTSLPANGGNADTLDNMHASEFATAGHTHAQYANTVHGHAVSDIAGLSNELDGKASTTHTHDYAASTHSHTLDSVTETSTKKIMTAAERTKLESVESGANKYIHPATHSTSEITGLATVATSGSYSDLRDKPTTMTPAAHTHGQNEVTGLTTALSGKANASHTHEQTEITGLSTALDGKASATHTHTEFAASSHTHTQAQVTGLGTALDGKANATHSHEQSEVNGLATALNGKANTNHTHIVYSSTASVSAYKLIYVAPNGSDNNAGFTATAPMATIKGAIKKYADIYKSLDIRLADGTYTENIGSIAVDQCNLSIRSVSENKDAVTINMTSTLEGSVNELRLYNMTLNVTDASVRPVSVGAGNLYAYNVRFNVPANSVMSCVNVYNGCTAFLMNCVLNSGTGSSAGAAVYGNQALLIKAINCTSERKVACGVHAHNGSDIYYTDTINATTKMKESSFGKCTVR